MINIDIDKLLEATVGIANEEFDLNIIDIDQLLENTIDW